VIIEHLIRAHSRGVKIHKLKHIKLHAKLLMADDEVAIVGSINLAPGSFDSRRELAIKVRDEHLTRRIYKTLQEDWANSHPLDHL
jgi:cardiolipin synthase